MNTMPSMGNVMDNGGGTPPPASPRFRYISLGLGKQSKALFAASCLGKLGIPRADYAIFADTEEEISDTYEELEWALDFGKKFGIPVLVVGVGISLAAAAAAAMSGRTRKNGSKFFVSLPLYVVNEDGSKGMIRRQCTNEFKLEPIRKKVRELLGLASGERANGKLARAMIGISTDEIVRAKDSVDAYIVDELTRSRAAAFDTITRLDKDREAEDRLNERYRKALEEISEFQGSAPQAARIAHAAIVDKQECVCGIDRASRKDIPHALNCPARMEKRIDGGQK